MTIEAMRNGIEKAAPAARRVAPYDVPPAWLDEQELRKRRAAASGGGRGGDDGEKATDVAARMAALVQRETLVPEVRWPSPCLAHCGATPTRSCAEQVGCNQEPVLQPAGSGAGSRLYRGAPGGVQMVRMEGKQCDADAGAFSPPRKRPAVAAARFAATGCTRR